MSLNQNNSLLLNRTVQQHPNRFLNANLNSTGNSSTDPRSSSSTSNSQNHHHPHASNNATNTMFNLPNTGRKISKSVNISSSLNPSALGNPNGPISSYQYSQYNSNNFSSSNANSQSNYPMIKNHSTPNFGNTSRKFSTDYQAAIRFDYSDAFLNNSNMDFLTRVSQMQRLQIDTVDWERKRKQSRKKITKALNGKDGNVKDEQ